MSDSEDLLHTDYIPIPEQTNLGTSYLTFDGLLSDPGLKVYEDGGQSGCGGKLWPAGELLSRYMIRKGIPKGVNKIVELGSGTGLVGLAIAYDMQKKNPDMRSESSGKDGSDKVSEMNSADQTNAESLSIANSIGQKDNGEGHHRVVSSLNSANDPSTFPSIYITDIDKLVPLMDKNVELNDLGHTVKPAILNWGEDLPDYAVKPDMILAADCVYLESAFPLLEKTLLDLTDENPISIFMAYKKRRKADTRFFKAIKKHFNVVEIKDHEDFDLFFRQSVHLFEMTRKYK